MSRQRRRSQRPGDESMSMSMRCRFDVCGDTLRRRSPLTLLVDAPSLSCRRADFRVLLESTSSKDTLTHHHHNVHLMKPRSSDRSRHTYRAIYSECSIFGLGKEQRCCRIKGGRERDVAFAYFGTGFLCFFCVLLGRDGMWFNQDGDALGAEHVAPLVYCRPVFGAVDTRRMPAI